MNDPAVEFAARLYRGDDSAVAAYRAAIADPTKFYDEFGGELGVFADADKYATPWSVLIDVGCLRGWVFVADWREFADEIASGLRQLNSGKALSVDWEAVAEDDPPAPQLFRAVAAEARPAGEALLVLDHGADDYPLAFVQEAEVPTLKALAAQIAGAKVELAADVPDD